MKWLWIIVLLVVGIIAAVFSFEYLTVGIGHLPSWVPGNAPHHHGHMRTRGYLAAIVAIAAFVGAGWRIYQTQLADKAAKAANAA